MKLKSKILLGLGIFAAALSAAALAGCEHEHTYGAGWTSDATHHWHEATCEHSGEKGEYAEHTWDSGTVTTAATCTEAGLTTYACTVCAATRTEPISATGHSFSRDWTTSDTHHWHEATCGHSEEKRDYAEHSWNAGEVTTPATCETAGVAMYTCTVCDAEKEEPIPATGHSYAEEWTSDKTHHWHEATCGHDVVSGRNEHFYEAGVCRLCGAPQPVTEGLTFNLINDGTEYEVGQSLINDTSVLIPDTHNGLPVTRIGNYAFYDRPNLRSITIPDSVTSIGTLAFFACSNLSSVTLGNSITSIEYGAFQICYRLTSITLPATLTDIGRYGFLDCVNLVEIQNNSELPIVAGSSDYGFIANFALHVYKEGESRLAHTDDYYTFYHDGNVSYLQGYWGLDSDLVLPSSFVTHDGTLINDYEINQYVFYGHEELTSIVIPDNVTSIGKRAFRYCDKLMNATIGDGVISIGDEAFNECQEMTHITIGVV